MEQAHEYVDAETFKQKIRERIVKDVEIPGIGWVKLQKLKLGEFDELEQLATPPETGVMDHQLFARLLILGSLVEPALPDDATALFDEMDSDLFTQLSSEVRSIHGETKGAQDELVARFPDEGSSGDEVGDPDSGS